jgi:hypothetical protein
MLEDAYALGKMMDSSGWNGLLRNGITPSDIDLPEIPLCFDNNGNIIFCDFSRTYDNWENSIPGQRWLYESLIRDRAHCAALCKHNVTPDLLRKIDTLRDVETFHIMVWDFERVVSPVYDGALWQRFVTDWVNRADAPLKIRRSILGIKAGLVKPSTTLPVE